MSPSRLTVALIVAASLHAPALWAADAAKAARYYEDALGRYERNDDAGAIIQLKNALQQDPSYLSAYLLLGQAQLRKGDASGAELSLTTALKMGADRMEVLGPLAEAYMRQRKFREVLERVNPQGLPAEQALPLWLTRAYAHLSLNDFAGAEQAIGKASALSPQAGSVAVARGMFHLQRGAPTEARQYADQAVAAAPRDPRAWNLKASVAHSLGDAKTALDGYGRALALEPDFIDVRVARAGLLLDLDRPEDAFKDLSYLKTKFPDEARAAYLRSVYFERKGDRQSARSELLQAAKAIGAIPIQLISGDSQLLMLGALTNFSLRAYEQAQTYAEAYVRRNPGNAGGRKLAGAILLARGQTIDAVAHLESALRNAPNDPQILDMLASAYMSGNQPTKAANLLERAGPLALRSPELAGTLGFSLIGLGRPEQGAAYLARAFAKNPASYRLGSSLVMLHIYRGQPGEAVGIAETFLSRHPKDPAAYNLLGVAKASARDPRGARGAYDKALALAPGFLAARLNLGKLELSQGKHAAARQQFQAVLKQQPKHPQAQFELGNTELAAGRAGDALRWLEAAYSQAPDNTVFGVKLIDTHLALGQTDKALALAKQLSARKPEDFDVNSALGRAHAASGEMPRAHAAFAKMSKIAGFNVPRLEETARLQLLAGDLGGASLSLTKALGEQPGALQANLLMADLERRKGQTAQALERVRRLAAANPRSAAAQRGLGDTHASLGQPAAAAQAYRAALAIADEEGLALSYHGALQAGGNAAQGLIFIEDWSRRHPQAAQAKIALGEALIRAGQLDKARATYEAYLKQHGEHPAVLNNLAALQLKRNDGNALATAERAYRLAPGDPAVNDTLGQVYLRQGDYARALRHLREARLRAPTNPEVRYHLALALHKHGRNGEALKELRPILQGTPTFDGVEEARQLLQRLGP
ncbi:MAG: XrtA/PEP-CTERM system TPR-repeat protein PrsT [Pseudomonadota bacterium]